MSYREEYKGYEIEFSAVEDKFIARVDRERAFEGTSLRLLKKSIDASVRKSFTRFKAYTTGRWNSDKFRVVEVTSAAGGYVWTSGKDGREKIAKHDIYKFTDRNTNLIRERDALLDQKSEIENKIEAIDKKLERAFKSEE